MSVVAIEQSLRIPTSIVVARKQLALNAAGAHIEAMSIDRARQIRDATAAVGLNCDLEILWLGEVD